MRATSEQRRSGTAEAWPAAIEEGDQLAFRAVIMRGGTSRGAFLRAGDLPLDPALRDRLAPRVAILDVRPNTPPRGPPRADERLAVLRSDDHGTVSLTLRPGALELRSRR
jgi:hypothetical protein